VAPTRRPSPFYSHAFPFVFWCLKVAFCSLACSLVNGSGSGSGESSRVGDRSTCVGETKSRGAAGVGTSELHSLQVKSSGTNSGWSPEHPQHYRHTQVLHAGLLHSTMGSSSSWVTPQGAQFMTQSVVVNPSSEGDKGTSIGPPVGNRGKCSSKMASRVNCGACVARREFHVGKRRPASHRRSCCPFGCGRC
jgi:hypothetical protein